MNHSATGGLPSYPSIQEAQRARCNHTSIYGAHSLVTSDTMHVPRFSVTPPQPTLTLPTQGFLTRILGIFYYSTRFLGLHRVWSNAYSSILDANHLELENAPTSRRSRWSKTVRKMNKVWALIIAASSLIITLSVAFLQIDNILNHIYPRTFTISAFLLSSASLAVGCVFIANRAGLDCVAKFRQWEMASQNENTLASVDFWACLALPLTSLAWSIGFCLMTLFSLAWVDQGSQTILSPPSKVDLAFSTALISIAILYLAIQLYRVRKFLTE